jgi:hypothetical protein
MFREGLQGMNEITTSIPWAANFQPHKAFLGIGFKKTTAFQNVWSIALSVVGPH